MDLPKWVIGRQDSEMFVKTGIVRAQYVYQGSLGRFFVGRTGLFTLPAGQEALMVLSDPAGARKRVFIQAMSVTSNQGRRAIFWFDPVTEAEFQPSLKVANAHRGMKQMPEADILLAEAAPLTITAGIDVFERLLIGQQTLLLDQEGKYILDPGHSHGVQFPAIDRDDEIDVAVAWWEEPVD